MIARPAARLLSAGLVIGSALAAAMLRSHSTEAAIYQAATQAFDDADIVVVSTPSACDLPQRIEGVAPALVDAFRRANAAGASPDDISSLHNRFAIADPRQVAAFDAAGIFVSTAGNIRKPLLRLSRIGLSSDRMDALLCLRGQFGSSFVHLHNSEGVWQVVDWQVDKQI